MSLLDMQSTVEMDTKPNLFIKRIEISNLFGVYSYDLALENDYFLSDPNLMILYGDNGSGKTTILRMIFNLLSPEENAGHRSYLARTPFTELRVTLSDETIIEAVRSRKLSSEHNGQYIFKARRGNETIVSHQFALDPDGAVSSSQRVKSASYHELISFLSDLNLKFHYLGDDRKVALDYGPSMAFRRRRFRERYYHLEALRAAEYNRLMHDEPEDSDSNLQEAISRAEEYVRREAFARSTRGSENANTVYTQLIERLVKSPPDLATDNPSDDLADLQSELEEIENRNKSFERLGLSASLNVTQLQELLGQAPLQFRKLITEILEPYAEGINARLDALQNLHDTILTFMRNLNEFYANKHVTLHLNEGIRILTDAGQPLEANKLSSGEKQLLLLLCNAISARDEASVLIIDEPEISLNVKWQRRLIRALLDCMRESPAQLIFATHSLEIVSQYRDNLVRLDNLNKINAQ